MTRSDQAEGALGVTQPEAIVFADDGLIPNSQLPLLLYRRVFRADAPGLGDVIEERFAANRWGRLWRDTVFPFPHYHSTSHEVLGVYRGAANLRLGGRRGGIFEVGAGDVIVIPAGVGHERVSSRDGFSVVGGYPDGRDRDLLFGRPGERPQAERAIARVPVPTADPVFGTDGPLRTLWRPPAEGRT